MTKATEITAYSFRDKLRKQVSDIGNKIATLKKRVNTQKFRVDKKVSRNLYLQRVIEGKKNSMIKVVSGMRRCGKSYLLFNLFYNHLLETGVAEDHIIKIDLEDRRNLQLRDPDELLHYIDSQMKDKKMYYILLDEVQHIREFEDVLNSYLKIDNADVYVTGSNSRFLSTDIITEFRGRSDEIRVHPLNFREFMSVRSFEHPQDALREYMTFGGLPQAVTLDNTEKKRDYLSQLFETTYLKDIKERHKITDDSDLKELINVLASSVGSLTNPLNLQNTFRSVKKSGIAIETVNRYIEILQNAFMIEKSLRFDVKGKRYISTPLKYYFEDVGLRNAMLDFRQMDEGHLMENMIYNELRMRGFDVDVGQIEYNYKDGDGRSKRTNLEVDFVCNRGSNRYYIQCATNVYSSETMERETRPLLRIKDSFPKIVLVGGLQPTYQTPDGIIVMNVWDFLMNEDMGV